MREGGVLHEVPLLVNQELRRVACRTSDTLLSVLRNGLGLTGAKAACENGDCGACTILLDGMPINGCLVLAVEVGDRAITTVEGLHNTPIQRAFVQQWAFQCGYCTSGFLVKAHALVTMHPDADDRLIKEWLQSNLCRCTGYREIEAAVKSVLAEEEC